MTRGRRTAAGLGVTLLALLAAGGCRATVGGTGTPGARPSGAGSSSSSPAPGAVPSGAVPSGAGPAAGSSPGSGPPVTGSATPAPIAAPLRTEVCDALPLPSVQSVGEGDFDPVQPAGGCVLDVFDGDGDQVGYVDAQLQPGSALPDPAGARSTASGLTVFGGRQTGATCRTFVLRAGQVLELTGGVVDSAGDPCALTRAVLPAAAAVLASATFHTRDTAADSLVDDRVCATMDQAALGAVPGVGAPLVSVRDFGADCVAAGPVYRLALTLTFADFSGVDDVVSTHVGRHVLLAPPYECSARSCTVFSVQGTTSGRTAEALEFTVSATDPGRPPSRDQQQSTVLAFAGVMLDALGRP